MGCPQGEVDRLDRQLDSGHAETVVCWHKESFKKHWGRISRRGPGRPLVSMEIRDLVRQMAMENDWGAPRIHAELLKLGFIVSQATVSRHLPKRPAEPDKVERWKRFLRNHLPDIAAMDFFTIPTASFKLLYGLVAIHHDRRRILYINVTESPTAQWVIQQLWEAFPLTPSARYLIHDRDTKFSAAVKGWIRALGLKSVQTAFRAPWQNGICERWIGSLRRELLDHVVIFNERHARRLVGEYVKYHQIDRCHLSLAKDAPEQRPVQQRPPGDAQVIAFPRVGGIHHRYEWKQAA